MENSTCDFDTESLCELHRRFYLDRPEEMLHPQAINPAFWPIVITHAITFLLGVVGNTVVIITWAGSKPNRSENPFLIL